MDIYVKKIREAIGNDMIISAKIDSPDDKYGIIRKVQTGTLNMNKL